eukprot:g224.t1
MNTRLNDLERLKELYSELASLRDAKERFHTRSTPENLSGTNSVYQKEKRLLICSHRIPFIIVNEGDEWNMHERIDPTANMYKTVIALLRGNPNSILIGVPPSGGDKIPSHVFRWLRSEILHEHRYLPVQPADKERNILFALYCKSVLWPLFHSIPPSDSQLIAMRTDYTSTNGFNAEYDMGTKMWEAYEYVNHTYCDVVVEQYQDDDIVWIHNYHLLLLPAKVRQALPSSLIGFSFHVPFPTSELFRVLSRRLELLKGILNADVVSFNNFRSATHFLRACERLLGTNCSYNGVLIGDHVCRISVNPLGIDAKNVEVIARSPPVVERIHDLMQVSRFQNRIILLGIDRLDVIKGLEPKFLALERLLENNPEMVDNVILIQVAVESMMSGLMNTVERKFAARMNQLVGRINGRFATASSPGPIYYLVKKRESLHLSEACALYAIADVMVLTPMRDGMNLLSYDYVVCRHSKGKLATVVLSEVEGMARTMGRAILLSKHEKQRRHVQMYGTATELTVRRWSHTFKRRILQVEPNARRSIITRALPNDIVLEAFHSGGKRRFIMLDYDSIRTELNVDPLSPPMKHAILHLARTPGVFFLLISALTCAQMEREVGDLPCSLMAENGVFFRGRMKTRWISFAREYELTRSAKWQSKVLPIIKYFAERTPGSFIEIKVTGLLWNFKDAVSEHAHWQANELLVCMKEYMHRLPISIILGDKSLSVRSRFADRGRMVNAAFRTVPRLKMFRTSDFTLVILRGRDRQDKGIFNFFSAPNRGRFLSATENEILNRKTNEKDALKSLNSRNNDDEDIDKDRTEEKNDDTDDDEEEEEEDEEEEVLGASTEFDINDEGPISAVPPDPFGRVFGGFDTLLEETRHKPLISTKSKRKRNRRKKNTSEESSHSRATGSKFASEDDIAGIDENETFEISKLTNPEKNISSTSKYMEEANDTDFGDASDNAQDADDDEDEDEAIRMEMKVLEDARAPPDLITLGPVQKFTLKMDAKGTMVDEERQPDAPPTGIPSKTFLCTVGNRHRQMQTSYYIKSKDDVTTLLQALCSENLIGPSRVPFHGDYMERTSSGNRQKQKRKK